MSATAVKPDPAEVRRFIDARGLPMQVVTIDPDNGKIEARLFTKPEPAVKWIVAQNAKGNNCYYTTNELAPDVNPLKKPRKADIGRMLFVHVDLDPPDDETPDSFKARAAAQLKSFTPPPSMIVDSGNGLQAFWRLKEPVEVNGRVQELEGVNIALAAALHGDRCHNIERLMRTAGTVNWPDATKRAKGRVPVVSKLLHAGPESYALDELPRPMVRAAQPKLVANGAAGDAAAAGNASDLVGNLPLNLQRLIREGVPEGERHQQFHHVVKALKRAGLTAPAITAMLAAHPGGIASKFVDRLEAEVERSFGKPDDTAHDDGRSENPDGRPTIRVVAGELHNIATAGERALIDAGEQLYVRGPHLVRPVTEDVDAAHGRRTKAVRLALLTSDALLDRLGRVAHWTKFGGRAKKEITIDPPRPVAATIRLFRLFVDTSSAASRQIPRAESMTESVPSFRHVPPA